MKLTISIIKRFIFYGVFACVVIFLFEKFELTIKGDVGFVIFMVLSAISGVVQTLNIAIMAKVTDIAKIEGLGVWAKQRLKNRVLPRKRIAFFRAIAGVSCALVGGVLAGYMKTIGGECVEAWLFGLTILITLFAVIFVFLTFYEFHVLSIFETAMHEKESKKNSKLKALKSIREEKTE